MRRIGYGLVFLLMFFILFTGCASFKPVDLNPRIQSGQLVQKTDNFVVLFDKSASMDEIYLNPERMRREKEKRFSQHIRKNRVTIGLTGLTKQEKLQKT